MKKYKEMKIARPVPQEQNVQLAMNRAAETNLSRAIKHPELLAQKHGDGKMKSI